MNDKLEGVAEKVVDFFDKKGLDYTECYIVTKSLMEDYWDQMIDNDSSDDNDLDDDNDYNDEDYDDDLEQDDDQEDGLLDEDEQEDLLQDLDEERPNPARPRVREREEIIPKRNKPETVDPKPKMAKRGDRMAKQSTNLPPKPLIKKPKMNILGGKVRDEADNGDF